MNDGYPLAAIDYSSLEYWFGIIVGYARDEGFDVLTNANLSTPPPNPSQATQVFNYFQAGMAAVHTTALLTVDQVEVFLTTATNSSQTQGDYSNVTSRGYNTTYNGIAGTILSQPVSTVPSVTKPWGVHPLFAPKKGPMPPTAPPGGGTGGGGGGGGSPAPPSGPHQVTPLTGMSKEDLCFYSDVGVTYLAGMAGPLGLEGAACPPLGVALGLIGLFLGAAHIVACD